MATRADHRRDTLLQLSRATTAAFEQHGAAATIDDIAARAGVSRRTVFRYVDAKEDLLFIHPMLWFDVFDKAIAGAAGASLRERLAHATRVVSEHIDDDPEPVRRAMRVAVTDPTLMRGYADVSRRWVDRIADEVRAEPGVDTDVDFRAHVLGSAVMAVIDAALAEWMSSEPTAPLGPIIERGLDYLAPVLQTD